MKCDTELLPEKIHACDNNQKKSFKTKISNQTECDYSLFTHCSFDSSTSKHNFYRGADCTEKFCENLRKHTTDIVNHEKKRMFPLSDEKIESYNHQKLICKK